MEIVQWTEQDELKYEELFQHLNTDDWKAIDNDSDSMPVVAEMLKENGTVIPLRIYDGVDLGNGDIYLLLPGFHGISFVSADGVKNKTFLKLLTKIKDPQK